MNAETNDALRKTIPMIAKPNSLFITRGIAELNSDEVVEILARVKDFDDFKEENDPWKEHDFGSFDHNDRKIFWKIDDYEGHEGFNLILTVMLAEEY